MSVLRLPDVNVRCPMLLARFLGLGLVGFVVSMMSACETVSDITGPSYAYKGTAWVVEDIDGNGVIDFAQTRIRFNDEGRVNGNGGCNTFFGSYQVEDDTIRFSPMATTQMFCEPAVSDQEVAFMGALGRAELVRVESGIMYLDDADGATVLRLSEVEVVEE